MVISHCIMSIEASKDGAVAIKGVGGAELSALRGTLNNAAGVLILRCLRGAKKKIIAGTRKPTSGLTHLLILSFLDICHPP